MVLNRLVVNEKFDLLHGHGIWQMPVHEMAQIAKRTGIPYVIAPHGMLEPWPLNAGKWKRNLPWHYTKEMIWPVPTVFMPRLKWKQRTYENWDLKIRLQ